MDAITLLPAQTALLLVDVQEKLLPAMPGPDAARLMRSVLLLVDTAKRLGLPVFATEQYPAGLGSTAAPLREALAGFGRPVPVVAKTEFDAMGPLEVSKGLVEAGARSVIVVGMEAHVCVFQTVRSLRRRGFHAHVPFDAVASRDPRCRDEALALLRQHGASVTTTETAVFDLLGDAKHPEFRALSKQVRALLEG